MAIDVATFRIRFEEFSDASEYPDARIQLFIDDSIILYMGSDENRWCGKYNIAQAYSVAHLLDIATRQEAGDSNSKSGPISSKTAGGVSVTRAVVPTDKSDFDNFFMSGSYGQQFLIIRNSCFVGVSVANIL